MSSYDYRENVKNILGLVSTTIDDFATPADIIVMYEDGPENLKHLFYVNDFDVVITVGRPRIRESGDGKRIQGVPLRYNADVPVTACAIDKTGVTAAKLLNRVRYNIQSIVGALAQRPTFTLIVETSEPRNNPMGGYDPLWMDTYVFRYRPMEY